MTERQRLERRRRFVVALLVTAALMGVTAYRNWSTTRQSQNNQVEQTASVQADRESALQALGRLAVRGRAPRDGYSRNQFGSGWASIDGCDTRNRILQRDLEEEALHEDACTVLSGTLRSDPYTGKAILFTRGPGTSDDVQIDHVVALSDAWQKGAQGLASEQRRAFANDGLNLLATDGPTNMEKGDADAAEWLPPNEPYRCRYIARQIAVKLKYMLWVTQSEHSAMNRTLQTCPAQVLPIEGNP